MTFEVQLRNSAGVIGRMSADNPEDAASCAQVLIADAGSLFPGDTIRIVEVNDSHSQSEL